MRIFLLGCTGFIGSELIPKLLDQDHTVIVVGRKILKGFEQARKSNKLIYFQIDPSNVNSWKNLDFLKALEESDAVVNLVGEPIAEKRWTKEHCKLIENSRLDTTRLLVEAMSRIRRPPKVLVNASAIGFYGTSLKEKFDETSSQGNDFLAELCAKWEKIAISKPRNTRLVIFRLGIVLGPNGGALGKMLPIFRAGFGGPLGSGLQWMSWIHRTDLCQLISNALVKKSWQGVFNAVAPNPVSMAFFSTTLGKILGRPSILPVPGAILKLVLGDGAKVVLEGQNVASNRLEKFDFKFKYPSLEEALNSLIL